MFPTVPVSNYTLRLFQNPNGFWNSPHYTVFARELQEFAESRQGAAGPAQNLQKYRR
jgi:hypothetical protein